MRGGGWLGGPSCSYMHVDKSSIKLVIQHCNAIPKSVVQRRDLLYICYLLHLTPLILTSK